MIAQWLGAHTEKYLQAVPMMLLDSYLVTKTMLSSIMSVFAVYP